MLDLERRVFSRMPAELDTGQVVMNNPAWSPGDSLLAIRREFRDPGFTLFDARSERASRWFDFPRQDRPANLNDWSPDGRQLLLEMGVGPDAPRSEVWLYDIPTKKAEPLIAERGDVGDGRFSPDGRWIAYRSDADGENQIYLRPFPEPGKAIRLSPKGGRLPRWRGDGRELSYAEPTGRIMAVEVRTAGIPGTPMPAIVGSAQGSRGFRSFEPTPDGQRFAFVFEAGTSRGLPLVLNWWKLLKGEQ